MMLMIPGPLQVRVLQGGEAEELLDFRPQEEKRERLDPAVGAVGWNRSTHGWLPGQLPLAGVRVYGLGREEERCGFSGSGSSGQWRRASCLRAGTVGTNSLSRGLSSSQAGGS